MFSAAFATSGDRDIALDAVQEAFIRAFVRWSRLSREAWAEGWVVTTAMNLCRNRMRILRAEEIESAREAHATALPSEYRVDLLTALRNLPHRQRLAIILYYLLDMPIVAVAQTMNVSEGAVKAHLAQARKALRRTLEVADV